MQTDPLLLDRARRMRRQPTEAESRLWRHLRNRQIKDIKFARQVPIGPYIADFVARSVKLVIEVDGHTHTDQARDDRRTAWLNEQEYLVIRFSNLDIIGDIDGVCQTISAALAAAPHPDPLPAGEREECR